MFNDNRVSVVIVTYNSGKYILSCLESVVGSRNIHLEEVVVVDNASRDNTVEAIQKVFEKDSRVKIIRLHKNMGFPYACNLGVACVRSRYVVLMNPDTTVDPYCFASLLAATSGDNQTAAVQPKILNPRGYIDSAGGLMDILGRSLHIGTFEKDQGQYDRPRDIFYACFACAMVRRDVYMMLGGMDSRFFLYNEDLDFCWRCWLAGYRVLYAPKAIAYHVGQHATRKLPYQAIYFGRRNRLYTVFTNYPLPVGISVSLLLLTFYLVHGLLSVMRDKVEARLTFRIAYSFFRDLKYLAEKRLSLARRRSLSEMLVYRLITFKLVRLRLYLARLQRSNPCSYNGARNSPEHVS